MLFGLPRASLLEWVVRSTFGSGDVATHDSVIWWIVGLQMLCLVFEEVTGQHWRKLRLMGKMLYELATGANTAETFGGYRGKIEADTIMQDIV